MKTSSETYIASIYSSHEYNALSKASIVSRRLGHVAEIALLPELFSQPIDLELSLPGNTEVPIKNMEGYPKRSLENTIRYIDKLKDVGISKIFLRPTDLRSRDDNPRPYSEVLNYQHLALLEIRNYFPVLDLSITLDPFGLALNDDYT